MSQSNEAKISDLTVSLAKHFVVLFYAFLIADFLTALKPLFKYDVVGPPMYLLFFLSDTLYSLVIRRNLSLKDIALDSLFDVIFIIP